MIEIEALTKRYGDVVAVNHLSLTVQEGQLLVLLGGSGSEDDNPENDQPLAHSYDRIGVH